MKDLPWSALRPWYLYVPFEMKAPPRRYGFAYENYYDSSQLVVLIPFNLLVRAWVYLWRGIVYCPSWWDRQICNARQVGYRNGIRVGLKRADTKVAVIMDGTGRRCNCSCADPCLLGKVGSESRCTIEELKMQNFLIVGEGAQG